MQQTRRKQIKSGPTLIGPRGSGGMLPLANFEEISAFRLKSGPAMQPKFRISVPQFF